MIKNKIFLTENLIDIDYLFSLNNWLDASEPNRKEGQKSTLGTYNIPPDLHEVFHDLYLKSKKEIENFYNVFGLGEVAEPELK
jgi:hypothetical protein